jgi:hypothetical protein
MSQFYELSADATMANDMRAVNLTHELTDELTSERDQSTSPTSQEVRL